MVTKIVLYGMMFGAVVCLLWANKQYKAKGAIWARPLSIILGVFAVILAIIAGYLQVSPRVDDRVINTYREREATYQTISSRKLGALIAKNHSSAKAMLVTTKYSYETFPGGINPSVSEGLKQGLGGNVELFVTEKVFDGMLPESEMGPDGMPPEIDDELYSAKVLDELVKINKDCKVIISLCGLPPDFKNIMFWRTKDTSKRPTVYLYTSDIYELKPLIKHGLIGGCIVDKPEVFDIRDEVPKDEEAAFNKRFLLITPENVDAIAGQYPLFKKEK